MTRIGWCPGGRLMGAMLAMYPGTTAVRVFVGAGKPLPAWNGPVLGPIPPSVLIHVSFKTWDVPAVERWLMAMPEDHAPIILTYAHEPEQGVGAGDPTVEQFRARWAELVAALADHPRRPDVLLVPVYTRFWWQAHPGDVRWLVPMVDAYGWDIYNNGPTYRTPGDLLSIPRDIAKRTGLPYLIAELGATDIGPGRSEWMRGMVDAAKADGALTVCWFHKDEWDLTASKNAAAQAAWRDIIEKEASVTPHLAPSLAVLRAEINARWPGRDHTSDGWIGDARHQATKSDHNPNSRNSVDAADFDEDGIDFGVVFAAIKRHPSARYVIYERKLYHRLRGWKPEPYDGVNPHDKHFHVSIDQTHAAEQNTQPWGLLEDDMQLTDKVKVINDDKVSHSSDTLTVEGILAQTNYYAILTRNLQLAQRGEIAALRATVDQLTATLGKVVQAGGGSFDQAALLTQLDERLTAVRADMRDAVADLGEGGSKQVRGPQR